MAVTHVGTAGTAGGNSASIAPTWPSGVAANDVAYVFWTMSNTSTPTASVPTGFTQVATNDGSTGSSRIYIFRKVCAGTESGTLTCSVSTGATRMSACLVVYRGVDTTTPEDSSPAVDTTGVAGTTHNNPQETTVNANCVIVCSIHERATNIDTAWTPPSGYTERADTGSLGTGSGGTITAVADLLTPQSAGASVTPPDWTGNHGTGTANVVTYTMALRAASSGSSISGTAVATLGGSTATVTGAVDHPGVVTASSTLTATATGSVDRRGSVALDLGAFTASASGLRETFGTATVNLGGTGTVTGLREVSGTSAATLGGLSATAAGGPVIAGTAAGDLGALTATAAGGTSIFGTAAASLSVLTATSAGFPWVPGTAVSSLGALTATSTGLRTVSAVAVAAIGGTATATGLRTTFATSTATLGGLSVSASSIPVGHAVAAIDVVATAVGLRETFASSSAALGALGATATGTGVSAQNLFVAALGDLTATTTGLRQVSGVAELAATIAITAVGAPLIAGTAESALGELVAAATGAPDVGGQAVADLGELTADAVGATILSITGTAEVDLPGITVEAVGTRVAASAATVTVGFVAVAVAFPHQLIRTPRAGIPTTGGPLSAGVPVRAVFASAL